jgi:hypothetical protein
MIRKKLRINKNKQNDDKKIRGMPQVPLGGGPDATNISSGNNN